MDCLSTQDRCSVVEIFIECGKSPVTARRRLQREQKIFLNERQIRTIYQNFLKGKVDSQVLKSRKNSTKNVQLEENIRKKKALVVLSVNSDPKDSIRRRSAYMDLSKSTLQRILQELKFHPYKLRVVQELLPDDYQKRMQFCEWFLVTLASNENFLDELMFTDEAKFFIDGAVSSSHARYWSLINTHQSVEKSLDKRGVMVLAGLTSRGVIGPFFFEDNVNQHTYEAMLTQNVLPAVRQLPRHINMYFMQDGAPAHRTKRIIAMLKNEFPNKLIALGSDIPWPPRSPCLTPCDFFLWGFLKQIVYKKRFENLEELKEEITRSFEYISPEMLRRTFHDNLPKRIGTCVEMGGGHVE